jgi:hypothetical protein
MHKRISERRKALQQGRLISDEVIRATLRDLDEIERLLNQITARL